MSFVELQINDDHPLALEITSLRSAVAQFQHETHAASLKLQRHSLDSTIALERAQILERENAAIREELAALRAHPDVSPHPSMLQVPELTLTLRRMSDKLTTTEETLLARTAELTNALSDLAKSKHEIEGAYALAARTRAREEQSKFQERELQRKVRAAEEARRMTDHVVEEYADLVRSLEGRASTTTPSSSPSHNSRFGGGTSRTSDTTLVETLKDGKTGLQRLLEEFNGDTERLENEIGRLHGELELAEIKWEAEKKNAERDRANLAQAKTELEKHQADDKAAAKMVSRYMRFSQSTTNSLQQSLENLRARHTATTSTLHLQISSLQSSLASERRQAERLRSALDELTEQLAREAYGRRREVALRLAVVGREDALAEALRRWLRRAAETYTRATGDDKSRNEMQQGFASVVEDAGELLALVDADARLEDQGVNAGIGSVARILAAQDAVKTLVEELQNETEKRMKLERLLGKAEVDEDGRILAPTQDTSPPPPTPPKDPQVTPPMPQSTSAPIHQEMITSLSTEQTLASVELATPSKEKGPAEAPCEDEIPVITVAAVDIIHQPSPRLPEPEPRVMLSSLSDDPQDVVLPSTSPTSPELPNDNITNSSVMSEASQSSGSPSTHTSAPTSIASPSIPPPHPLLAELAKVKDRYDTLQRAFRDCHLTLRDLKETIPTLPPSPSLNVLQTAVARLDDYNEDARVELEIRVSDEERITRGYETLLSVQGALSSEAEAGEVEAAVRAFVDGTEAAVARARSQFSRKLDDLEHDIAAVKRRVHELPLTPEPEETDLNPLNSGANPSWTSLAAGFFAPPRPASPSITFGSVMTSPRLRRPASSAHMHVRGGSSDSAAGGSSPALGDRSPFATLDLRIPMPNVVFSAAPSLARSPPPRPRTMSGMYMLGLGMRNPSLVGTGNGPAGKPRSASIISLHRPAPQAVKAVEAVEDEASDVE